MDNKSTSLPELIRQHYPQLTETQKKVAEFYLNHEDTVAFLTVDRLAAQIGVSASSITRFANELGFNGYPDLQNSLRINLQKRLNPTHRLSSGIPLDANNVFFSSIQKDIANIEATLKLNSTSMMDGAVKLIREARHIYVAAFRSSYCISSYIGVILEQILGNVTVINSLENMMPEYLVRMKEDDLLISISFPRYNLQTVQFTEQAKKRGLGILAISDSLSSPLLQFTNTYLLCKFEGISFHNSYVPAFALVNSVCAELAFSLKDELKERLTELDKCSENVVMPLY